MTRACTNCIFCVHRDYGYSNYTVEGTKGECLFSLAPEFESVDYEYASAADKEGLDRMMEVAAKCPHFIEGTGLYYDCDGNEDEPNRASWIAQYIKSPEPK